MVNRKDKKENKRKEPRAKNEELIELMLYIHQLVDLGKILLLVASCSLLVTPVSFAQGPSTAAELNGDTVEYSVDGNKVLAKGNVIIKYQDSTLYCDQVEFYRNTQVADASGHVRLITGQGEINGEKLTYNFEKMSGEFNGAKIFANPYYGQGKRIRKVGRDKIYLEEAKLTSCDLDKPHFSFSPKRVEITPGQKLVAKGTKIVLGKVPVMYLPSFTQRLDHKKPVITFTPGFTKEWGAFLLSQYNFYLNDYLQGALHFDLREKRGIASGFDVNYKIPSMGSGLLRTYYMDEHKIGSKRIYLKSDTPAVDRERFKIEWRHKWDIDSKTNAILQYTKLSDADILKDYFKKQYEKDTSPQTFFLLTRQLEAGTLSFRVDKRVNRFESKVERLPEIRYDLPSQQIGTSRLYFRNISTYSNLAEQFPSPTEERLNTQRVDVDNELSYPTKVGIIEFKPFIGGRETYYSKTKSRERYDVVRGVFTTGATLSTKFYKIMDFDTELFGVPIKRLRHIVTPTIDYRYQHDPTIASDKLDIFDSIDSQTRDHTIVFGLENKLQTKRDGKVVDLARILVNTDFLLKEDPDGGGFNKITTDIDLKPFDWLSFYFDSEYNTRRERLETANFDFFLNGKNDKWSIGLGKRFQQEVDDQITAQLNYRINQKWKLKFYDRFDTDRGIQKEQDYTLTRDLHCWEMDVNFNETRGRGSEILMIFRLKAFPELSIDAGSGFNRRKAGSQSSEGN